MVVNVKSIFIRPRFQINSGRYLLLHIAIKYFYARDLQGYGVITHNYVNSKRNYSDMMTKAQGANLFSEHAPKVLGGEELEPVVKRKRTVISDEFAWGGYDGRGLKG